MAQRSLLHSARRPGWSPSLTYKWCNKYTQGDQQRHHRKQSHIFPHLLRENPKTLLNSYHTSEDTANENLYVRSRPTSILVCAIHRHRSCMRWAHKDVQVFSSHARRSAPNLVPQPKEHLEEVLIANFWGNFGEPLQWNELFSLRSNELISVFVGLPRSN
jgi:hypothetical protein